MSKVCVLPNNQLLTCSECGARAWEVILTRRGIAVGLRCARCREQGFNLTNMERVRDTEVTRG